MESKIFNAGLLSPNDWLKYGYLDGLRTFDQEFSTYIITRIAFETG